MRLDINLATRPYEDARRFWMRWGGVLAGVGLLTLILVFSAISGWFSASKDRQTISKLQADIAERDQERTKAEAFLNRSENRSTRDRSQFLNELIRRKAFSWTKVFEDLERVMPPRVHVVAIRPELNEDNQLAIKMQVEGDSRERALDLVRKMESSPHFRQTKIDAENTQSQGGNNVSVDISALYVRDIPGAGKP
jgi:type IV pilus assembly protein PilN